MLNNILVFEIDKPMAEYACSKFGLDVCLAMFEGRFCLGYIKSTPDIFFCYKEGLDLADLTISDSYYDFNEFKRDFDRLTKGVKPRRKGGNYALLKN